MKDYIEFNLYEIVFPIEIVEAELLHFTRAQAVDRTQHENRSISDVAGSLCIQTGE